MQYRCYGVGGQREERTWGGRLDGELGKGLMCVHGMMGWLESWRGGMVEYVL